MPACLVNKQSLNLIKGNVPLFWFFCLCSMEGSCLRQHPWLDFEYVYTILLRGSSQKIVPQELTWIPQKYHVRKNRQGLSPSLIGFILPLDKWQRFVNVQLFWSVWVYFKKNIILKNITGPVPMTFTNIYLFIFRDRSQASAGNNVSSSGGGIPCRGCIWPRDWNQGLNWDVDVSTLNFVASLILGWFRRCLWFVIPAVLHLQQAILIKIIPPAPAGLIYLSLLCMWSCL